MCVYKGEYIIRRIYKIYQYLTNCRYGNKGKAKYTSHNVACCRRYTSDFSLSMPYHEGGFALSSVIGLTAKIPNSVE